MESVVHQSLQTATARTEWRHTVTKLSEQQKNQEFKCISYFWQMMRAQTLSFRSLACAHVVGAGQHALLHWPGEVQRSAVRQLDETCECPKTAFGLHSGGNTGVFNGVSMNLSFGALPLPVQLELASEGLWDLLLKTKTVLVVTLT